MKKILFLLLLILFITSILAFSLRGISGNPSIDSLNTLAWTNNGPFELSPDRGRFALMYSFVENKSFYFSLPIARFAVPDLGYNNGHYVSLFAPGVSFIVIPGYIIGKVFNLEQVGTFAVIALFAIINALLLRSIIIKLGSYPVIATICALVFLFATPAFTYAVTLYQHHISTFLILLSIYILLKWKNIWSLSFIWLLCAASIVVDNPNLFLMFPIGIYALMRMFITKKSHQNVIIKVKLIGLLTCFTVILPLVFFAWFNQMSYGNPFQLSGTVSGVSAIDKNGKPAVPKNFELKNANLYLNPEKQHNSAVGFFKTRNISNGLYEHLISADRGILWFTPIMFFSIFGMFALYKKNPSFASLLLAIIGANLLLYSMWGDPWGGWAFGSRYMIPAYAIMAIFIASALEHFKKNYFFLGIFLLIAIYCVFVNTAGAITSSANPPKVEVLALEKLSHTVQKYTYERNIDMLKNNQSKSFVWQTYLKDTIPAMEYYLLLASCISAVITFLVILFVLQARRGEYEKH